MKDELWVSVVRAIETALPEYDMINEKVSMGLAQKARLYGADRLQLRKGMMVLDAGIGPGTMSEVILSKSDDVTVVGLDASITLLSSARERLQHTFGERVHFVRAAFEKLPFKEKCFDRIVSAYAFRDSRDRNAAMEEFHRATTEHGTFAVIDLGKPENVLKRTFIGIYVRYFMPLIARLSISDSVHGNPWRMIFPTYQELGTNGELVQSLKGRFSDVQITELGWGGVVVLLASKT